jgi:hypothetical protein
MNILHEAIHSNESFAITYCGKPLFPIFYEEIDSILAFFWGDFEERCGCAQQAWNAT